MPKRAEAIFGKIFCHVGDVHGSSQEGGDQERGRPTIGVTTIKLYKKATFLKKYMASLNQNLEIFGFET